MYGKLLLGHQLIIPTDYVYIAHCSGTCPTSLGITHSLVPHTCNPSTGETEAGGSRPSLAIALHHQLGLYETLFPCLASKS